MVLRASDEEPNQYLVRSSSRRRFALCYAAEEALGIGLLN